MRHPALLLVLLALPLWPALSEAQGVNGRARTYVNFLQVRELILDSVPAGTVPGKVHPHTVVRPHHPGCNTRT